ncbi:uncharacterized protein DUF1622 [Dietzia cinnamea]|uniref:Uncharacterized protein DUF1622 n=1 Tax=Dietzia cinnamea TaxID=321318 RepID=A0A4R3ZN98_9ACTN|nr:uncharacterized protein DUF1622 [Dietzia cinnamea]
MCGRTRECGNRTRGAPEGDCAEFLAVLAAIVVIRTFLSWSLELELSGRWPWQKSRDSEAATPTSATSTPTASTTPHDEGAASTTQPD